MAWVKFKEGWSIFPNFKGEEVEVKSSDILTVKQYEEQVKKFVPKGFKTKVVLELKWLNGSVLSFQLKPKSEKDKLASVLDGVLRDIESQNEGIKFREVYKANDLSEIWNFGYFKPNAALVDGADVSDKFDEASIKKNAFVLAKDIK